MVWISKSIRLTRRPIEYCLYRCACVCRGPIWQSMLSRIKQRSSMCKCFVCLRTIHFPCIQTLKRLLDQALDPESHLDPVALDPTLAALDPTLAALDPTLPALAPTLAPLAPPPAPPPPTLSPLHPPLPALAPTLAALDPTLAALAPTLAALAPTLGVTTVIPNFSARLGAGERGGNIGSSLPS